MNNGALQWINLHEDHVRNKLSEVGPFPSRIATSSPFGKSGDPEIELWNTLSQSSLHDASPLEFRDQAEFYVCGKIPEAKDPVRTDEKIIAQYGIGISK